MEVVVVTVRVEEPAPVMDVGLKLPLGPVGNPLTLSATLPANPFTTVVEAVYVVLVPAVMVREAGVAESEKSGAFTISVTVALRGRPPLVPVIVSGKLPPGVVLEVITVSVDEPAPVIEAGLKLPEAPEGNPLTLRATLPAKLFKAVVDTVYVVPPPGVTVWELGVAATVKS